jgi:hypothetical protein
MERQIFGFTPPNPETGQPGYLAAHLVEAPEGTFVRVTVRPHAQENAAPVELALPWEEAAKLALSIIDQALQGPASGEDPLLQLFAFAHLPPHLQAISAPFGAMAARIVTTLPRNPERSTALRKLREAKDCAVTASIWKG